MRHQHKIAFVLLSVVLGLVLIPGLSAQTEVDPIRQWAIAAEASSQYGDSDWSAAQATGAPDTATCGDLPTAWASSSSTGQDSLTVYFEQPVFATAVDIYQTYNPGAIIQVTLIAPDGDESAVPKSADSDTPCPGTFELSFPPEFFVQAVRIDLDQTRTNNWNEIDAVELVGFPDPGYAGPLLDLPAGDFNTTERTLMPDTGPNEADRDTSTPATSTPGEEPPQAFAPGTPMGLSVTCDNGRSFDNGIPITVIQMRSNSNYTATAVGINGFDPVLAVLDESGRGLCDDDNFEASYYQASLPTTGLVEPSGLTSQIVFNTFNQPSFSDIRLVVGGFGNATGQFLLFLEGMTLSSTDNEGDPFSVEITPGMVASGVSPTVYMISVVGAFDPLVALIDSNYEYIADEFGNPFACDDAGNSSLCYGTSFSLNGSYVSRTQNRQLPGGSLDAMLTVPLELGMEGGFLNFLMRSAQNTFGDYVVVFHMGIGDPAEFIELDPATLEQAVAMYLSGR
jgi:hypothetical protein